MKLVPCEEHSVRTNQYWAIHPTNLVLRSAKVFLLGHVVYIAESGKPKASSIVSNKSTEVVLNMYEYNESTKLYSTCGRSSLLPAQSTLITDVTCSIKMATEGLYFDHGSITDLTGFEPFHPEVDISTRVSSSATSSTPCQSGLQTDSDDENDPYIVERIVKKRFNSQKVQYEYFVKWLGYSSKQNTWELPSNIPGSVLDAYEQSILETCSTEPPRRAGLRERSTLKAPNKPDFIVNK